MWSLYEIIHMFEIWVVVAAFKIWVVWIADETLSWVSDISSQLKQKLRSKQRGKIVKIYTN